MTTTWQDLLHPGIASDFFNRRPFPPFEPQQTGYLKGNALWLAELSRLVYRHDIEENPAPLRPTRSEFLQQAGFRQRRFFISAQTDTQAMLVESIAAPAFAVLAFRGTEQTPQDFATDLKVGIPLLSKNHVDVHKGFAAALDSVWHEIELELSRLDIPVFYTGHSLGAALATLAAARHAPQALYTFGSPRVGNAALVQALSAIPAHRVVDDRDVVTTVPFEVMGFRHVGQEQRLRDSSPPSWFNLLTRLRHPPKPLADHAPINYVDRI